MRLGKFPQATVNLLDSLVAAIWHEQYVDEEPRVATCVLSRWFPSHLLPFKSDGLHKFLINYKSYNVYCSNSNQGETDNPPEEDDTLFKQ